MVSRTTDPGAAESAPVGPTSPPVSAPALDGVRASRSPAISLRKVGKSFGNGNDIVVALRDINLDIADGELVAIVGPSGCGKSTIIKMVAGLNPPSEGELEVLGEPLRGSPQSLGVAFQQDLLLPWRNILKNVILKHAFRGGDRRRYVERARELLDIVGLREFESKYPRQLSGGMRQRAAICRALVDSPRILLLDEPFGALDAITRDQIALDFQRLWMHEKSTVIFVTHSIDEAVFLADRVVVLSPRPGRIQCIVEIDLERPRTVELRDSDRFSRYRRELRKEFEAMGLYRG
jgi:NitT/TauT family transport system ATP-binding protein